MVIAPALVGPRVADDPDQVDVALLFAVALPGNWFLGRSAHWFGPAHCVARGETHVPPGLVWRRTSRRRRPDDEGAKSSASGPRRFQMSRMRRRCSGVNREVSDVGG